MEQTMKRVKETVVGRAKRIAEAVLAAVPNPDARYWERHERTQRGEP